MPGFDIANLLLRKFEIQVHYNAAYLFWDLKGVLAERWGHGPYFGAYSNNPNELRLTVAPGKPSPLVAIAGLKASAFVAEGSEARDRVDTAQSWLKDCFETLKPRVVTRMLIRHFYSYQLADPERTSRALMREMPGLDRFVPDDFDSRHGGLQFQVTRDEDLVARRASGVFGVFGPHQQSGWFSIQDDRWHLGLDHSWELTGQPGIDNALELLETDVEAAADQSATLARQSFARTLTNE